MLTEQEIKEFQSEVAVPAYREFCRKHGLRFPRLNESPEIQFDYTRYKREFELHEEAMALFNLTQPSLHVFGSKVVKLHLNPWFSEFGHAAEPVNEFLRRHTQLEERLAETERRYQILRVASAVSCIILMAFLLALLPPWLRENETGLAAAGFCLIVPGVMVKVWIGGIRHKRRQRQEYEIHFRMDRLRERLEAIQRTDNGANTST